MTTYCDDGISLLCKVQTARGILHKVRKRTTQTTRCAPAGQSCTAKRDGRSLQVHYFDKRATLGTLKHDREAIPSGARQDALPPTRFIISPRAPLPPSRASSSCSLAWWDFCRACVLTLSVLCLPWKMHSTHRG